MYCAGICTCGRSRWTASLSRVFTIECPFVQGIGLIAGTTDYAKLRDRRQPAGCPLQTRNFSVAKVLLSKLQGAWPATDRTIERTQKTKRKKGAASSPFFPFFTLAVGIATSFIGPCA